MTTTDVVVTDNPAARRYEAHVDGVLAGLAQYRIAGDHITFTHTEVYPRWEGQGVGGALARAALDEAVGKGLVIVPECRFIAGYIAKHPEYQERVARDS